MDKLEKLADESKFKEIRELAETLKKFVEQYNEQKNGKE